MLYFTVICIALQCSGYCSVLKSQSKASETYYTDNIRGKIIVTGLSKSEDDEFLLSLLNGQHTGKEMEQTWNTLTLVTDDVNAARKTFLSRNARYSGLLDILNIVQRDINISEELDSILREHSAWLALGVPRQNISTFADIALANNIKRVIFTVVVEPDEVSKVTHVDEFSNVIKKFRQKGAEYSFTGIRHGQVIPGDENKPYEIVNSSSPLRFPTVEKGILARVVTEVLHLNTSFNNQFGVSTSGAFADAYLQTLRSIGFTRRDEVNKLLTGGMQQMEELTKLSREERERMKKERENKKAGVSPVKSPQDTDLPLAQLLPKQPPIRRKTRNFYVNERGADSYIDEDDENSYEAELAMRRKLRTGKKINRSDVFSSVWDREDLSKEAKIRIRARQILEKEYQNLEAKGLVESTSLEGFCLMNKDIAEKLAREEYENERDRIKSRQLKRKAALSSADKKTFMQLHQYRRLLQLEERELHHAKKEAMVWLKFWFILLKTVERILPKLYKVMTLDEIVWTAFNKFRTNLGLPSIVRTDKKLSLEVGEVFDFDEVRSFVETFESKHKIAKDDFTHTPNLQKYLKSCEKMINRIPILFKAKEILQNALTTIEKEVAVKPKEIDPVLKEYEKLFSQK